MSRAKLILFIIAFAMPALWPVDGAKSFAASIFHDDFSGNALDGGKWEVDFLEGRYFLENGSLYLYSYHYPVGNGFPAITTVDDPFPTDSDWTFTTYLRYLSSPNIYGTGIAIFEKDSAKKIAYISQHTHWGSPIGGDFHIWDENSGSMKLIWSGDTSSYAHTFSVERSGSYYNGYVDGELVGSAYNTALPGSLLLGNAGRDVVYGRWNPMMIDYVNISVEDVDPIPTPEPGTFILTASGIFAFASRRRLRLRAFKK